MRDALVDRTNNTIKPLTQQPGPRYVLAIYAYFRCQSSLHPIRSPDTMSSTFSRRSARAQSEVVAFISAANPIVRSAQRAMGVQRAMRALVTVLCMRRSRSVSSTWRSPALRMESICLTTDGWIVDRSCVIIDPTD
jgi:hypothetical protein